MRVVITIDPQEPHRDWVRDDAESWLGNHARSDWRVREDEDWDCHELLTFEFSEPLDETDFQYRTAPAE